MTTPVPLLTRGYRFSIFPTSKSWKPLSRYPFLADFPLPAGAVGKRLGARAPTGFPLWKRGIEGDLMKGSVPKSPLAPLFQRGGNLVLLKIDSLRKKGENVVPLLTKEGIGEVTTIRHRTFGLRALSPRRASPAHRPGSSTPPRMRRFQSWSSRLSPPEGCRAPPRPWPAPCSEPRP